MSVDISKCSFVKLINTSLTDTVDESTNFKYHEGLYEENCNGFKIVDATMSMYSNWAWIKNLRYYADVSFPRYYL